jgi:hypothetical protein
MAAMQRGVALGAAGQVVILTTPNVVAYAVKGGGSSGPRASGGNETATSPNPIPENLTHQNDVYEILTKEAISGTTRGAHRAAANRTLLKAIQADPQFARQLSEILKVDDVAAHMTSGRSALRNPPGTEWHHPIDNPCVMELLRRNVHRHPELRQILHPDNVGGFGAFFGK